MSHTEIAADNCLSCNETGNLEMLQCSCCLKQIHSKCLTWGNEKINIENVVKIDLFKSINGFFYICKNCETTVNAIFVSISQKKVAKETEKQNVNADVIIVDETNQIENEREKQTVAESAENEENKEENKIDRTNAKIEKGQENEKRFCRYFNTGSCIFDKNCKNKHTDISSFCRHYMRTGRCNFEGCKYVHPPICRASQQNNCYKKSCDFFHSNQQKAGYRKDRQDRQRNYENQNYPMRKNENQGNFLEKMMRDLQQQLGYMQKMMMPQNPRLPINGPQIYPQFPQMAFPPPPQQPPLGRPY